MVFKRLLTVKHLIAPRTGECFFTFVTSFVRLQTRCFCEAQAAHFTHMCSITGMCDHMFFQQVSPVEASGALRALVFAVLQTDNNVLE